VITGNKRDAVHELFVAASQLAELNERLPKARKASPWA